MARVSIAEDYTPVDVDLWGVEFDAKPLSRSFSTEWTQALQKVWEADTDDEAVRLLGQALDLRLKPKGSSRKKPSTVLDEKWKGDKLTIGQVNSFIVNLGAADSPN